MKKHIVFVYGTLRKHESNHHLLRDTACVDRKCWTEGELYDSHLGYPFLIPASDSRVYGEAYQIDDLQLEKLDQLEGYEGPGENNYYDRTEQLVHTDSESFQALVYILPVRKQPINMERIESGDWRVYRLLNQNFNKNCQ